MAGNGKRYVEAVKLVDPERMYSPAEAIALARQTAGAKFDESIDVAVRLGVDPRHADQVVRGAVVLPHGTGRAVRVLVFAKGEKAKEAEVAGADYVGAEDLVAKIQGGWLDFDVAVSTPDMMALVGKLGKTLGPRGLMPNPRTGTVTFNVGDAIREIKAGKVEFRTDKAGITHVPIGRASFPVEKLVENFETLLDALVKAKPEASKGQYIRGVSVSSTMGPGISVTAQRVTVA